MTEVRIEPASEAGWTAVEHALTGGGDGATCWCQWFLLPRRDFDTLTVAELRERLHRQVGSRASAPGESSPGLIAFVDGEAAGWVRAGPRALQPRLLNSRVVKSGSPEPGEAADVWAVSCLVVRREFRGQGLAARLVAAATKFAAHGGARVVEAYAIDTDQRSASTNELFVGSVRLFAKNGFHETSRPLGARVVMTFEPS